ncbi:TolC family protein [Candidatus Albibeggiatoa sp. nov. BB20]|uniref:TolC family protein n=1 Tax=Candidatus Albibeggiatoa sp. nov. BB20 TaxID=3162723 RepID=UPI00336585F3
MRIGLMLTLILTYGFPAHAIGEELNIEPPGISITQIQIEQSALNKALQIVIEESPSLEGQEVLLGLKQRKKIWESNLRLSAISAQKQTNENASGTDMRGALTFQIPLFDDGGKSENVAKAKQALNKEKDRIVKSFLDSVTALVLLYADYKQSDQMLKIADEELKYNQQAQKQGLVNASSLWSLVKERENAAFKKQRYTTQYQHEILMLARLFGGVQWEELQENVHKHIVGFDSCGSGAAGAGKGISLDTPAQCS